MEHWDVPTGGNSRRKFLGGLLAVGAMAGLKSEAKDNGKQEAQRSPEENMRYIRERFGPAADQIMKIAENKYPGREPLAGELPRISGFEYAPKNIRTPSDIRTLLEKACDPAWLASAHDIVFRPFPTGDDPFVLRGESMRQRYGENNTRGRTVVVFSEGARGEKNFVETVVHETAHLAGPEHSQVLAWDEHLALLREIDERLKSADRFRDNYVEHTIPLAWKVDLEQRKMLIDRGLFEAEDIATNSDGWIRYSQAQEYWARIMTLFVLKKGKSLPKQDFALAQRWYQRITGKTAPKIARGE